MHALLARIAANGVLFWLGKLPCSDLLARVHNCCRRERHSCMTSFGVNLHLQRVWVSYKSGWCKGPHTAMRGGQLRIVS